MAAVLACGRGAALSHRSAAARLELIASSRATIDVTSPTRAGRTRTGIDVHRGSTLAAVDVAIVGAIPTTSLARTLLDLAAVVPRRVLARASTHRGAAALRAVLTHHAAGSTRTRNDLEEAFLAICRAAGLPRPEVNAWIALPPTGAEADFLWRAQRLIAEVDGGEIHMTRRAFEHDRGHDQRLMVAGWRVVRFTWRQVFDEPAAVDATMRALVAQRPR